MFNYKNSSFYNEYFSSLADFNLVKEFEEVKGRNNNVLLSGSIDVIDSVHPIKIDLEIPRTFPHSQMTFWTKSLAGYPHLIYDNGRKESWFCFNTPFAETAEEQLNQEMSRLRGWLERYNRKDLPAFIDDNEVKETLRVNDSSLYRGEISEYSQDAQLTFLGDFANDVETFIRKRSGNKELQKTGRLFCIKNKSERFFVTRYKLKGSTEIPYVLVDELPNKFDFIHMKDQYNWDNETCMSLLPDIAMEFKPCAEVKHKEVGKDISEEEANRILDIFVSSINNEESYFNAFTKEMLPLDDYDTFEHHYQCSFVLHSHKQLLLDTIVELRNTISKSKGIRSGLMDYPLIPEFENEEEEDEYYALQDQAIESHERYLYSPHYFALGWIKDTKIAWYMISTCFALRRYTKTFYNLDFADIVIRTLTNLNCSIELAQEVKEKDFFGRGQFCSYFRNLKIGVVGAGAIGSIVCESLARSGVGVIGIWDDDTVEPGNICRSTYDIECIGEAKNNSLLERILSINPFIRLECMNVPGKWYSMYKNRYAGPKKYRDGSFYGNVNYNSQDDAVRILEKYDLIIDCTASNELLHFISYAVPNKKIISLSITNRAKDLLCITNRDGNPYELRKMYLSKLEQDTKNFFVEGTGCYSPTFLATYSDVATLTNLALKDMNSSFHKNELMHSTIWSYTDRGIVADRLKLYGLSDSKVTMTVSTETIMDGEDLLDCDTYPIGYALGGYSCDGTQVMISHIIGSDDAKEQLERAFYLSGGIIDYLGDFTYSGQETDTYSSEVANILASKASDASVNVKNPVLILRNPDRTLSFYIYIGGRIEKFVPID